MDAIVVGEVAGDAGGAFDLFWNAELAIPVAVFNQRTSQTLTEEQMARLVAARERVRPAMEQNQETTARADWLQALPAAFCGQRQRFWLIVQIGAANFPIQRSRRSRVMLMLSHGSRLLFKPHI